MKKGKKFFDAEIKAVEGERSIMFTASDETRDRDGDVMVAKGWRLDNFMKNPVFLWAHDYRQAPIGKAVSAEVVGKKLRIKVEFVPPHVDEFAEKVYQLYKGGFMKTVSVGFQPYKMEELTEDDKKQSPEITWGKRIHADLLELSAVPVPANPNALAQRDFAGVMAKGVGTIDDQPDTETMNLPKIGIVSMEGKSERAKRATLAALLGARCIVDAPVDERKAVYEAHRPAFKEAPEFKEYSQDELREMFKDVWNDELLDVIQTALETKEAEAAAKAKAEQEAQAMQEKVVGVLVESMGETLRGLNAVAEALK